MNIQFFWSRTSRTFNLQIDAVPLHTINASLEVSPQWIHLQFQPYPSVQLFQTKDLAGERWIMLNIDIVVQPYFILNFTISMFTTTFKPSKVKNHVTLSNLGKTADLSNLSVTFTSQGRPCPRSWCCGHWLRSRCAIFWGGVNESTKWGTWMRYTLGELVVVGIS